MVIRFAIEPEALIEHTYISQRDLRAQHKRLIGLWEQYGVLIDPVEGPDSITSKFDNQAFRKVRELWREAWKMKQRCRRVRPKENHHIRWDDVNSVPELAAYEHLVELALVETARGTVCLGIPEEVDDDSKEDVYSTYCGGVEAALFKYPEHSVAFSNISDLSKKTVIPANRDRSKVWAEWFNNLARRSSEVVIIDRYGASMQGFKGICWTLRSLARCMAGGDVSLFCSNPSTLSGTAVPVTEIVKRVTSALAVNPSKLASVTLFLIADYEMTKDRYVSFDEFAFSIGHGLSEVFRTEYVDRATPCILDTQPRGVIKIVRNEAQRLVSKPHQKLLFTTYGHVKTENFMP